MFSRLNSRLLQHSFLLRLLQTTGLSLALMTASAAGVRAEDVTVQGAPGANGADAVNPGDLGGEGGPGGPATASASSADPLNTATAVGGIGGGGGNAGVRGPFDQFESGPGDGGIGGAAKATAVTTIISGSAGADAVANGGNGGNHGAPGPFDTSYGNGGSGGAAAAIATGSSGNGNATVSASATGGSGTPGEGFGGFGADANASSTAIANGSSDASSSANATGGNGSYGIDGGGSGGSATATASASAGSGKAIATAVATPGIGPDMLGVPGVQATANAKTVNGAMAQALSTVGPYADPSLATSTAKTSFGGVSVQSDATNAFAPSFGGTVEAIAEGGSVQTFVDLDAVSAISVALPNKAYATTLIGDASNVAAALLGPGDEIFGAGIIDGITSPPYYVASSTFDFSFRGDLILGVIDGSADITVNGAEVSTGNPPDDTVINLGFFGPNIDLTISGFGTFVIGGAVPEASTWAMLLLGFGGLGFVGYRQTRGAKPQSA